MTGQVNYLVEAPELGQECYVLHIQQNLFYSLFKWGNKDLEKRLLALHRVYANWLDAQNAAEFLKGFFISHKEQLNYLTSEPKAGAEVWFNLNMDSGQLSVTSIYFDPNYEGHQSLLKRYWLYRTREDLVKDINLITEALEEEYKKAH